MPAETEVKASNLCCLKICLRTFSLSCENHFKFCFRILYVFSGAIGVEVELSSVSTSAARTEIIEVIVKGQTALFSSQAKTNFAGYFLGIHLERKKKEPMIITYFSCDSFERKKLIPCLIVRLGMAR